MSARDELRREMTHNHLYMTDERADELIDAFAHELAEEQRALADANDELDHDHHRYGFSGAAREVAALIDPQALRAGPEGAES